MKLFYGIILVLIVFVSACSQQPQSVPQQPADGEVQPQAIKEVVVEDDGDAMEEKGDAIEVGDSFEVRVIGQGAFDPDALTINVGDSVTWINTDEKDAVILIFKDGRTYQNSPKFKSGESFELEFTEPGEYQYWRNIAYGSNGGTITVE